MDVTDKLWSAKVISLLGKSFSAVEEGMGNYISGTVVLLIMVLVAAEVIGRLAFNHSFLGLYDVVGLSVAIMAFLSLSTVQRSDQHLKMDLLVDKFKGKRVGSIQRYLNLALPMIVSAFLCYVLGIHALRCYERSYTTMTFIWPMWPVSMLMSISLLLLSIRFGIQIKGIK